jgi:hypothetical protein
MGLPGCAWWRLPCSACRGRMKPNSISPVSQGATGRSSTIWSVIRGNGLEGRTAEIEPGASATLTVDLEPGTYSYLCTTGGHDLLGMRGTLTVTAG